MTHVIAKRRVGGTDVHTTVLGLGSAPLGNLFEALDHATALDTVNVALEVGVEYFDTAPQYGHGRAEHRFGHVLREQPRDSFVLSTKVGRLLVPAEPDEIANVRWVDPLPFRIEHDYTRDAVLRSIEHSWQRLGMKRIDLAYIHDVDRMHHGEAYEGKLKEALDGAVPALAELRDAGIIGGYGIGVNEVEPCLAFAENADLDAMMLAGRYTLLEQGGLDDLLPLADRKGFSIVVAGPFNSGILATGAREGATYQYQTADDAVLKQVHRIEVVCAAHSVPLGAASIQFPLGQSCVATVVTGAVRPAEIRQNAAWMAHSIPAELWSDLKSEGLIASSCAVPGSASL
ncbi:MAG: aldo/keto reductase [Pseudomonadota bacterium]